MPGPIGRLQAVIGIDSREFDTGIGRAQKSLTGFGKGADLAMGLAAGAVAGGLLSTIGAAREWETAFVGVRKTVDTAGMSVEQETKAFAALESQLLDLSEATGVTSTELAGIAEMGGAMGIAIGDMQKFTETVALLSRTTDVTSQDAASSLGKIAAVTGMAAEDFDNFANALVALGNAGNSTEQQILAIANRMSGTASTIGLSTAGLLGWSTAMADVGIEAEAGASSFQRFALNIQQAVLMGTAKLDTLAEVTGMTREAFQDLWTTDSNRAMEAVIVGLGRLDDKQRMVTQTALQMNNEIRLRDFLAKLTGSVDGFTATLDRSEVSLDENRAMTDEWGNVLETTDNKVARFWASVNRVAITLGDTLMPAIASVAEHGANLVKIFGDAAKAFPQVTNVVVPLVTALSGLLALRFGAQFASMLIGPQAAQAVEMGMGRLFGRLGVSARIRGAVAVAGAAIGLLWEGAIFVASRFASAAMSLLGMLGGPRATTAAAAAGTKVGAAFAGAAGAGGLIGAAGAAIAAMAPLAIPAVIAITAKPILDAEVEKLDISQRSKDLITGNFEDAFGETKRSGEFRFPWEQGGFFHPDVIEAGLVGAVKEGFFSAAGAIDRLRAWDRLSDSMVPPGSWGTSLAEESVGRLAAAFEKTAPEVTEAFKDITTAIRQGFGNVKQALQGGDKQMIDPATRMSNMRNRLAQVAQKINQAIKVGDPWAISYWTDAYAKQQSLLTGLEGAVGQTKGQVTETLRSMGINVDRIWGKVKRDTKQKSGDAADAAITAAKRTARMVARAFQGIAPRADNWGADATRAFAAGLASKGAIKAIEAGVTNVMASVQDFMRSGSPTKKGPGSKDGGPEGWGERWGELFGAGLAKGKPGDSLGQAMRPRALAAVNVPVGGGRGGEHGDGCIHIHVHGDLINTDAHYRKLAARTDRALRPTRRERRRVHLAEG